eukprot:TRINITY_DN23825_c0_g1_i2.p2 TRINITY_DN23825_c0_g1~~TRINITY_DN23825_c0_g1_i2.p2  ORF type:complete len:146 (-),score=49.39 TRINITY_DN23825_c0_g1_i2:58-495(-)
MIRRPPRSTQGVSSAASDVYKRQDVRLSRVTDEGSENVSIRWLIGKDTPDAPFYMRVLELEPGGNTPFHSHEWEHEIFVLEGEGVLKTDNDELSLEYLSLIHISEPTRPLYISYAVFCLKKKKKKKKNTPRISPPTKQKTNAQNN